MTRLAVVIFLPLAFVFVHPAFAVTEPPSKAAPTAPIKPEKITVSSLRQKYGKPTYHVRYKEPITETFLNSVTYRYDEEIAFKVNDKTIAVYYFFKGKFLMSTLGPQGKSTEPRRAAGEKDKNQDSHIQGPAEGDGP